MHVINNDNERSIMDVMYIINNDNERSGTLEE